MVVDLGSLNAESDQMVIIATEPLTSDEPWEAFETGECKVFVGGEQVWRHRSMDTRLFSVPPASVGRDWPTQPERAP
jgi:glutamine amidotransferase